MNLAINRFLLIPASITIAACIYWLSLNKEEAVETITFFPIDQKAFYLDAKTTIETPQTKGKQISLPVSTYSRLNESAYLRQDITLLFANGRLIATLGMWKKNTDQLELVEDVKLQNNQLLRALSYHHSELHRNNENITSSQAFSEDFLYIISPQTNGGVVAFRQPENDLEYNWKEKLDDEEEKLLKSTVDKATDKFNINLDHYYTIPLTKISTYLNRPLPGFSKKQTDEIIGKLWEGIYKNYFLGIRKNDGDIITPIGSTIPIILLAKDRSHLYVVFETAENEPYLLKQLISR